MIQNDVIAVSRKIHRKYLFATNIAKMIMAGKEVNIIASTEEEAKIFMKMVSDIIKKSMISFKNLETKE